MTVEIFAVGGFSEVGKNMTAVKVDDDMVVFDMGLHLENYIRFTEDEDLVNITPEELTKEGAIPNLKPINKYIDNVRAIIPSHAHLDHVGAVPFLANKFSAPIVSTPFTIKVLQRILKSEKIKLDNDIIEIQPNGKYKINEFLTVEFVHVTHSTPHTSIIALHTPYGTILYANDFKFDLFPTFGKKPNFKRLEELGNSNVIALIIDSTYSSMPGKMPSESVAKELLKDVLLGIDNHKSGIIVTTFSSHLARLKTIMEFGIKMNRKVVFMGRSMAKYIGAGHDAGLIDFYDKSEVIPYGSKIKKKLRKIMNEGKEKYLLVVTGHQGEPRSTLSKMTSGELEFEFSRDDHVIFSCRVIPTPTNQLNRARLERELRQRNVHIFTDVHQSGHAAREDMREMIELVKPKHIFPAHGGIKVTTHLGDLAQEMGYKINKDVHLMYNGKQVRIV